MKHARAPYSPKSSSKVAVFLFVGFLWLALDRVTKLVVNAAEPGDVLVDNIAGLFEFRLVHNTGAAWGIFSQSTFALGIFSLVVCTVILAGFLLNVKRINFAETIFLALIFAGGLGNGIDRMLYAYVVDFINPLFIQFPVFNVADIGVTCGIFLFLIALFLHDRKRAKNERDMG